MVVDDDEEVRSTLAETLADLGYRVVEAGNGRDALAMLHLDEAIALAIADMRMPGMTGLEFAAIAQKRHGKLKVLLISGYFMPQPLGLRLLLKPFRIDDLASAVRALSLIHI